MVIAKQRSPQKRASLSQISKRISSTFSALFQRSGVRNGFFFVNMHDRKKADKLSKFCLSSQRMLLYVCDYVSSARFARRFCETAVSFAADEQSLCKFYASYGRLLRACTIFLKVPGMIEFVIKFFGKVHLRIDKEYGWTFLFAEALRNVNQSDYAEFMKKIFVELDLVDSTHQILSSETKLNTDELALRRKLFSYFLDDCEKEKGELRFRLSAVLRLLCPPKMEYKLLLILGAPIVCEESTGIEFIDYESPYIEVINDMSMVKAILGEISELMEELLSTHDLQVVELRWTEMQVFNLMETVTTYPEPWVLPNFAAFLLCSPRLARLAIYTRAIYGSVAEAGYTLFSCVEMLIVPEQGGGVDEFFCEVVKISNAHISAPRRLGTKLSMFLECSLQALFLGMATLGWGMISLFLMAVRLGRDPYVILHMAAREVSARCTVEICVTMFRESIVNAQQRCVEVFSAATSAPDRDFLYETLEVTKHIAVLFQNMLYLIFS